MWSIARTSSPQPNPGQVKEVLKLKLRVLQVHYRWSSWVFGDVKEEQTDFFFKKCASGAIASMSALCGCHRVSPGKTYSAARRVYVTKAFSFGRRYGTCLEITTLECLGPFPSPRSACFPVGCRSFPETELLGADLARVSWFGTPHPTSESPAHVPGCPRALGTPALVLHRQGRAFDGTTSMR